MRHITFVDVDSSSMDHSVYTCSLTEMYTTEDVCSVNELVVDSRFTHT